MSGLLQRLAGQALGAQTIGTPRIRPAAGVNAQVPVSSLRDDDNAPAMPTLDQDAPRSQTQSALTASAAQGVPARELATIIRSVRAVREFEPQRDTSRPAKTRAQAPLAPRDPPVEHASHDFLAKAPLPLLEEVQLISAPPAIAPVTPAPLPMAVTSSDSRSEPTEVHVHIGRIEVIAAPEPAAPKKNRAAPARNTLPLAEYLARRRPS